ncbi:PH domain-containing protein [Desulfoscipio geothermicus]|uniref:PH domain-containing protein n=1 Tax=Desulfoscipio geothermicus DSM 3669 TaxID=1121426 RepID=A0A1I6ELE0_9FIRM|nr:PH domain-containing protein [Desulfoscipio geothermicus]SFR18272.1 PH domain-containing protein [Desulfoscipio geothermicus DSM 3669]
MVYHFKIAPLDKLGNFMSNPLMFVLAICTIGVIWAIPFLFSPRSYQISPKEIVILLRITQKSIPKAQIRSIEIVEYTQPGVGLTWFTGLFGYAGLFALKDGNTAMVYATRWDRMVRINTISGDPYLLSPAEPEVFLEIANKIILER